MLFIDRAYHTDHADHIPRVHRPLPRATLCSDEQFCRIYLLAPTWFKCFLLLCRNLGLRHREASQLTPRAYNPDSNTITFKRKAGGTSHLPITAELGTMIRYAASKDLDAPLLTTLGCNSNTKWSISYHWRVLKKRTGADPNLIIHDLRRTAINALYTRTKDLRLAQQLAGHRDLNSTLHYISPLTDPDKLREVLPDIAPVDVLSLTPITDTKQ